LERARTQFIDRKDVPQASASSRQIADHFYEMRYARRVFDLTSIQIRPGILSSRDIVFEQSTMLRRDRTVSVDQPAIPTMQHFSTTRAQFPELLWPRICLAGMRTLAAVLAYTTAAVAMACGFVAVAAWLVAPDASALPVARAAPPIPPRIAESIERKMARLPEQARDSSPAPVSTRPAMQEARVSLVLPPAPEVKLRDRPAPAQNRPRKAPLSQQAGTATAAVEVSGGTAPVAAARGDIPY
jgi:hypothetical protein